MGLGNSGPGQGFGGGQRREAKRLQARRIAQLLGRKTWWLRRSGQNLRRIDPYE